MPVESGGRSTALALGSSFSSHTSFHLPRLTEDRKMMNPFGAPYMPHHMMRGRGSRDSDDSSDEFPIIVPTIWGPLPVKNKKSKRKDKKAKKSKKSKKAKSANKKKAAKKRSRKHRSTDSSSSSSSSSSKSEIQERPKEEPKGTQFQTLAVLKGRRALLMAVLHEAARPGAPAKAEEDPRGATTRTGISGRGRPKSHRPVATNGKTPPMTWSTACKKLSSRKPSQRRGRTAPGSSQLQGNSNGEEKNVCSQLEGPTLEGMEQRIRDAARLPAALLPEVAKVLASLPEDRVPQEMRWRQIEGSHFGGAILDLNLDPPDIDYRESLHLPDEVHALMLAHGTSWSAAYNIIREGTLRPQASKADEYPSFGAFRRGTAEAYSDHTSAKAVESVARKSKATHSGVVVLLSARAHAVQVLEGGLGRVQAPVRRDYAAKSASDQSICVRSEIACVKAICFLWPR